MHRNSTTMAIAIIACCIGLIFLFVSLCLKIFHKRKITNCTIESIGTVVDYEYKGLGSSGDSQQTWHPVFEYYANGKIIKKTSNIGTTKKQFEIGQRVTVFYNPEKESEYYVPEVTQGTALGTVFLVVGVLILVCGGALWYKFLF